MAPILDAEENRLKHAQLDRLLRPRSIALVGASSTPGSLGEAVLLNLEDAGYGGELYLVNPKRPVIHGRQCLGSIDEMPAGIDCAVLAIPGSAVLDSVRVCASKSVGSAIVFSAGFAETGEVGLAAQRELARIAQEHGMILEGPNCLGMVNYVEGIPLTFIVTPPQPREDVRGAAILSQSGALAAVIAVNMRHQGIPLTYSVSTGNEAANSVEDFLEHLIGDPATRVFALVVEQFRQPKRFLNLARRVRAAGQFIVLLHPGSSNAARDSAATHTGAIAGDYEVMSTLVTHAGVIHVQSLEELVDVTQILVRCQTIPEGGAAVFTESGAFKAVTLDLCDRVGLPLPPLSAQTEQSLREALPPFIPPSNPLDLTAQALVDPGLYRRTLAPIVEDATYGSLMLAIILTDPMTTQLKLPRIVEAIKTLQPRKTVVFAALDEGASFDFPELQELRALGIACFPSPERAIRALARVTTLALHTVMPDEDPKIGPPVPHLRPGLLSEIESKQVLARLGIEIPAGSLARNVEEAIRIATEIDYPVVLKAQSADLPHKSDTGAVILNIQSETELRQAWEALHHNIGKARPDLLVDGILVERMSNKGLELILGARNDPQWGPVLLVGFGGVLAEAIEDVLLLPPDLPRNAIEHKLNRLRCSKLLRDFRGSPSRDVSAVVEIILILGRLMRSSPQIAEIDINPLVVHEQGKGAVALDALISVALKAL
ncbi:MAG: acetate--CoA ligase family protein [Silvibacterium sp.]|nr:acetate--CoA ligase family protein [Silvibacterium sp.]